MNVSEPIRRFAADGDRPALVHVDGSVLTYRALDRAIDATAHNLLAAGFSREQPALLPMTGPDEAVGLVAAMALARLGIVSTAPGWPTARPGAEEAVRAPAANEALEPVPMWDDDSAPFRIFATSGTTGTPKHIIASHALMATRVMSYWLALGPRRDAHLCALSHGIIPGCTAVLRCWWAGGTLVLGNPQTAGATLHRQGVQSMLISPAALAEVLKRLPPGFERPPYLKLIETTGAGLPPAVAAEARARLCPEIASLYGANETGAIATKQIGEGPDDPRLAGRVVPGVRVDALGPDGSVLPAGEEGLLRVRTPGLVARYEDNPAQTEVCFRAGGFVSGDIGSVSADGMVRVLGRSNDVINAGGLKINPALIEDALLAVPGVTEAAAFAVLPDPAGLPEPWAAIVGTTPIGREALQAACNPLGALAPRRVLQVTALPRNANGKVLRDVLAREGARMARGPAPA